jgi:hypothetical protein
MRTRYRVTFNLPGLGALIPKNWRTLIVYGDPEQAEAVKGLLGELVTIEATSVR